MVYVRVEKDRRPSKIQKSHPPLFQGCKIYFNGRTGDLSAYHLNKIVRLYGGDIRYISKGSIRFNIHLSLFVVSKPIPKESNRIHS